MHKMRPQQLAFRKYEDLQPGELFIWPGHGEGGKLTLMVHHEENGKLLRIPLWLSDSTGKLVRPTFRIMEIYDQMVPSFGHAYEFVVDPLDGGNRITTSVWRTEGPMLALVNDRLALRAFPAQGSYAISSMVVDIQSGALMASTSNEPTMTFASWTLNVSEEKRGRDSIAIGRFDTPESSDV